MMRIETLDFVVGCSEAKDIFPAEYFPAAVPGAVQLDYAKAKDWGDYWYSENFKDYGQLEELYWVYQTKAMIDNTDETPYLNLEGVDYEFDVLINGQTVFHQEGMYTPVWLELSRYKGTEISVQIRIYPRPKDPTGDPNTQQEARLCCKPPVSYGWDWHPRLIPLGLYQPVHICYKAPAHFKSVFFSSRLNDALEEARVTAEVQVTRPSKVRLSVLDPNGVCVASVEELAESAQTMSVSVADPELWWCQGHGDQVLYTFQAEIVDENGAVTDRITKRSGFRRVRLVENVKYKVPETFPKTQEHPPVTIELNGRRIFAKGSNFVPPEIFPGIIDEETYRPLVQKAAECHMNLFRVWGGGGAQKDSFYALCDEMGIMVWQEFPLACNNYPDDPHYLQILDQESGSILRTLRTHPSIVLWCGGNELFNDWSGMTNQSAALRLLNKKCYELDPFTPFIATSPLYGMGHGHYVFRNVDGSEVIEDYINKKATAYTEFGCPGPASIDYIKKLMTPEEYADMGNHRSWKSHHAFSAWTYEDTWLRISDIQYYYGAGQTQEEILKNGAELQAQYYKHVFEEARRQWPYCSMVANWCYNEPWPCAANNTLLSWPAIEKEAYYSVKDSLRDACFSLRVHKLGVVKGELLPIDFYVLNHGMSAVPACDYEIGIILEDGTDIPLSRGRVEETEKMTVKRVIGLSAEIMDWNSPKIKLYIRSTENPALDSEYVLYVLRVKDAVASKRYY